ncbi:hypothetical protein [Clostridium sardiniense]|uniref:hypothetical protein n=1 Tax=Clostridium sardiniense TaxID=29369 RepID=UPI003D3339FC
MVSKKFHIELILFMIILTFIEDFAPPKYFVLSIVILPFIIIGLGLICYMEKSK